LVYHSGMSLRCICKLDEAVIGCSL